MPVSGDAALRGAPVFDIGSHIDTIIDAICDAGRLDGNLAVGVVTAINGASRGTTGVRGVGSHVGTIPMPLRQSATST